MAYPRSVAEAGLGGMGRESNNGRLDGSTEGRNYEELGYEASLFVKETSSSREG